MPKLPRGNIMSKKYNISMNRYRQLYYYCLQYTEWVDELKYKYDTSKALVVDDMPHTKTNNITDPTQETAIKCAELAHKISTIEQAAELADPKLKKYILKHVTNQNVSYEYMVNHMNLDVSKNTFYDRRRKFYWILSQNIE